MNVVTYDFEKKMLTQVSTPTLTEDGCLVGGKLVLFTNGELLGKDAEYADLVLPTFTGYADSAAVTFGAPILAEDDAYLLGGDLKQFACTGGTPDEQITGIGYYVGTDPDQKLLWTEKFDTAVRINGVGQGLRYAPQLRLGVDGNYGSGSVVA